MDENKLIFIISLPRSGSTYLQSLLSNNNMINTCSEPWILLNFANLIKPSLINGDFDNQLAVEAYCEYKHKFSDFDFKELQKKFLLNQYLPLSKGYSFVIDKTPRYWEMLEEIRELFPGSKMIILKRNPLKVAESIFRTWNVGTIDRMLNFKRDLLEGPFSIKSFENKYHRGSSTYFIKYEDLIEDTTSETRKIYNWLGIPFNSTVLDIKNNTKFLGKYGDPFLNSEEEYFINKKRSDYINLNRVQKEFLYGYAEFLGTDFMVEYAGYDTTPNVMKKTALFSSFQSLATKHRPLNLWERILLHTRF